MDTTYLVFDHREGSASEAVSSVVEERQLRDQPFRIYRIVPDLDKITVYARHVFYDLLDNMIQSYKPSSSTVGASVVQTVSSSCLSEHDFTFYSDLDSTAEDVEFENVNPVDAIDEVTGPIVMELFELVSTHGYGTQRAANYLNDKYPDPKKIWIRQTVLTLIRNPIYTGRRSSKEPRWTLKR